MAGGDVASGAGDGRFTISGPQGSLRLDWDASADSLSPIVVLLLLWTTDITCRSEKLSPVF